MSENALHQHVLPAFSEAQTATIALTREVVGALQASMTPQDVVALAHARARQNAAFTGWFHPPEVTFDRQPAGLWGRSGAARLTPGTVVQIDLAPATADAFGDFGHSFTWQGAEHPAVTEARRACRAVCGFASRFKCVGELFVFAQSWANNRRLSLGATQSIGHACLPREGLARAGWPLGARLAIRLRRNQIQWYNPRRMAGCYAVNPPIDHQGRRAAFEEMIFIDGEQKYILGRDHIDQIGSL